MAGALLGNELPVAVVVSIGAEDCVSAVEPLVDDGELEAELPFDELELLVLATLFGGLFAALLAVGGGGDAIAAFRLDASSVGVATSALGISTAAFVLATFRGGVDSVTFAAGGLARAGGSEVLLWLSSTAPPMTTATIVPNAIGK